MYLPHTTQLRARWECARSLFIRHDEGQRAKGEFGALPWSRMHSVERYLVLSNKQIHFKQIPGRILDLETFCAAEHF